MIHEACDRDECYRLEKDGARFEELRSDLH